MNVRYSRIVSMAAPARVTLSWILLPALLTMAAPLCFAQANAYRGLWVGEATMNFVNEVSIPLDEDNVPRASDPLVPTATADQASLRIIVHVNGAGQASLLKEVAIVDRTPDDGAEGQESDLVLLTDESLYVGLAPQAAVRIASATFDFGDSQTTHALDAVVDAIVDEVVTEVANASTSEFASDATRDALIDTVKTSAETLGDAVVGNADASAEFFQFLQDYWTSLFVDEIATNAASPRLATATTQASLLTSASFYGDSRASEMIVAVNTAIAAAGSFAAKQQAAQNWTSSYADVDDLYHRFIASQAFGNMIPAAAEDAALAASTNGSAATVRASVNLVAEVVSAQEDALIARALAYRDTRSTNAVNQVLSAIVASAVSTTGSLSVVQSAAEQAGYDALANTVARYPVSPLIPTPGYDDFIVSDNFINSAAVAAQAAAKAAVEERRDNSLYTSITLLGAAKVAAVVALQTAYSDAARTLDTELPLLGSFGSTNSTLNGEVYLPANHPTNPFRHRRHPDHTRGFDITRELEFSFAAPSTGSLAPVGYGVQKISGVLREEIHGLHKPLGTSPNNTIGLIVVGPFELRRISLIDTLNTL